MKLPQPAPDTQQLTNLIFKEKSTEFLKATADVEFQKAVRKSCGERYPYWDELKYWSTPPGVPAEWVWVYRNMISRPTRHFIPLKNTLGERFSFWLPDKAQELLHFIDQQASGPILSDNQLFHSRERYIAHSLTEEAIASSQIEGAATTRDAAKTMLRSGRKPQDKSERMIANNYRAIGRIRELKSSAITLDLVKELQAILTDGTLPDPDAAGRLRRSPDDDNIVVEDVDGIILHRPPTGSALEERVDDFLAFANASGKSPFIHPVIKAIVLHFWIAYDHPFVDGNGRTARALFYWFLLKQDYWLFEYISISSIVHKTYGQYRKAFLYSEAPGLDLTYFIMYNLRVIRLAIENLLNYMERKAADLQRANEILRQMPELNHRQRELLIDAVKNPGRQYTIRAHQSINRITYQTARTDLLGLQKKGFLDLVKSGKLFVYLPTALIEQTIQTSV